MPDAWADNNYCVSSEWDEFTSGESSRDRIQKNRGFGNKQNLCWRRGREKAFWAKTGRCREFQEQNGKWQVENKDGKIRAYFRGH